MDTLVAEPAPARIQVAPQRHSLNHLFAPRTIAVIGASETPHSVGHSLMRNLEEGQFSVFAVNPAHKKIFGQHSFRSVTDIGEPVDLALIATPADTVPRIVRDCVKTGVKAAVIISSGFREAGPVGIALEEEIKRAAANRLRIVGPNCLGIMVPGMKLNATFARSMASDGNVALLSQSGALCTAILDWSLQENVGFSAFVSVGSMIDVGWGDLISHFGDDPHTKSIILYMESIGDARAFLSAAREAALSKPIIVLKVGRTEQASKAAASHTGSLTGSDDVFDAACRRVGVLRVKTIEELFDMAQVLSKQPRPKGPRLAILTNAGGPGALATDMLICSGGELASLSKATLGSLDQVLPSTTARRNPIDLLGDADPDRYAEVLKVVANDETCDGSLVILTPQAMTDATKTARQIASIAETSAKPVLACWMGGQSVREGRRILNEANVCTFDYPDIAARAFEYMWRYQYNLHGLYETPSLGGPSEQRQNARLVAADTINRAQDARRNILTEPESKAILEAYGISVTKPYVARNCAEALGAADTIGYPVVLKLYSETVTHKSSINGVALNLHTETEVCQAWNSIKKATEEHVGADRFGGVTVQQMIPTGGGYELIVGSSTDSQFGPVLVFGAGGQLVEAFADRSIGLPPLNSTLARRMMEQTRIFSALSGKSGDRPVDISQLEQLLVRFSHLVLDNRWIAEIDINPLFVDADKVIALDARIILHPFRIGENKLPRPAIRPYPEQYVQVSALRDGTPVAIRPIRPEDEPLLLQFHKGLSENTVYHRYFAPLRFDQRVAHERLAKICFNDYDRETALVVEHVPMIGEREIIAVGRLTKKHESNDAEFAIVVSDAWQGRGLGTQLLKLLIKIAKEEKVRKLSGYVLADNQAMISICHRCRFKLHRIPEVAEFLAELELSR